MTREPHPPRALPVEPPDAGSPARGPRAFELEAGPQPRGKARVTIEESPWEAVELPGADVPAPAVPRVFSLAALFWAALWLLVTLYFADALYALVLSLAGKAPVLGQIALGLAAVVVLGIVVFLAREVFAILRMRKVALFRARGAALAAESVMTGKPDRTENTNKTGNTNKTENTNKTNVRAFVASLRDFYTRDATAAAGRAEVERALGELHEPRTLLVIAERALLASKDAAARRAIANAAQRVSVVTALSPRAIVDVVFVLVQSVGLIRRLSAIYGGRASGFGLLRLTARVLSHLAVTGGVAVADSFLSQIVGTGIATRLSAKLGEGVLNGVLTARVGIAATDLCRPLPFIENQPILLSEVVKNTIIQDKVAEITAA